MVCRKYLQHDVLSLESRELGGNCEFVKDKQFPLLMANLLCDIWIDKQDVRYNE